MIHNNRNSRIHKVKSLLPLHYKEKGFIFGNAVHICDEQSQIRTVCEVFTSNEMCNTLQRYCKYYPRFTSKLR